MVLEGWDERLLQQVCDEKIVYGIVQAGEHVDDGIPYIKSSDVGGQIKADGLARTSPEIHKRYKRSTIKPGDIIISLRGNTGASSIVPDTLPEANLTQGTARLAVNGNADNRFLRYQLGSHAVRARVHAVSKGSTFTEISLADLRKLQITLPPLPEQRKIADILSTWDAAIEKTEALLTTAKAQKRALMQSLLTGKRRFSGFDDQPWEEVRLRDVAKIFDGTHSTPKYVESGVPFYSVEHVTKDDFSVTKFISEEVFEKENQRVKLEHGDILMTRIGDVGTARLIDWDVRASFYVSLALIKPAHRVVPHFLSQYLNAQPFQRELHKRMIHVAFPKKINLGEIGNCMVRLPSFPEQERIAEILDAEDGQISILKKKVSKLRAEKKALMQQLLTGKRRVSV